MEWNANRKERKEKKNWFGGRFCRETSVKRLVRENAKFCFIFGIATTNEEEDCPSHKQEGVQSSPHTCLLGMNEWMPDWMAEVRWGEVRTNGIATLYTIGKPRTNAWKETGGSGILLTAFDECSTRWLTGCERHQEQARLSFGWRWRKRRVGTVLGVLLCLSFISSKVGEGRGATSKGSCGRRQENGTHNSVCECRGLAPYCLLPLRGSVTFD